MKKSLISMVLIASATVACATHTGSSATSTANPKDPYEKINRHIYAMNDTLDKVILKPVATIYKGVTPPPLRKGVSNAYENLTELPSFANNLLQGDINGAGTSFWRFAINSTLGVLGLFDVATPLGIKAHHQDLGMTFAKWGVKDSTYFVIPFFGPSTVRDAVGMPMDLALFSIYPRIKSTRLRNGLLIGRAINMRTSLLEADDLSKHAALDPYAFQRDAYLQYRANEIRKAQGLPPELGDDPLDEE